MTNTQRRTRYLVISAMLSAVSIVLMQFDFSVPLMPSFIKMDLSDLPALIGSFSMGPLYGVIIALVKNLLHLLRTSTGGIGELSNFLLSALFVLPAGVIYQKKKTRKRAIIGAVIGAACMAVGSVITNYFIVYPVYTAFMPMETIIAMYQAILPSIKNGDLLSCLVIFNMPFTFVKAMLSVVITLLIYKPLSPIIHGE
ncbi:MAG: ECF transporter S component [Lachnospiraceae bacterium]|nr:ECF transporter S component [Lachnospiraceae bacterium]